MKMDIYLPEWHLIHYGGMSGSNNLKRDLEKQIMFSNISSDRFLNQTSNIKPVVIPIIDPITLNNFMF